jgi:5'-phosphate synthase pdxT subunit
VKVGVLAIQGDFAAHARALGALGVEAVEVRRADELEGIAGLILPGGESTTMLKFLDEEKLGPAIKKFAGSRPVFGTCAGAILLAQEATSPRQASLGLIDISVERNGYGRQVDSFIARVETTIEGGPMEAVFIRAPRIRRVGAGVEVIARTDEDPVFVRQGNMLAATFHPELTGDLRAHRLFVGLCESGSGERIELSSGAAKRKKR